MGIWPRFLNSQLPLFSNECNNAIGWIYGAKIEIINLPELLSKDVFL
jgi:hypothetical protein